ncbi:MAG: 3D-(3,5/4)-trihydroxycyclohexane-1,2-dione acylhydrolase (decyclizing) [Christensenellales bacterium]
MKTVRLTMAQALLKFLDNQYIEFDGKQEKFVHGIIGIFGHGNVVGLGEALYATREGGLRFYQGHNEQGMAHAAIGYAKQNNRRKIIACTSSIGPGALNMVTAAGTATANRIPLLLLPGDTFATRQPDPVLQQVENFHDYTLTANDAFKPVSRYWDRITRPEQLMSAMLHAMRVLTDPADTGAVTVCMPQDVEGEAYDYPVEFLEKRIHYITRPHPDQRTIDLAADLIAQGKKPYIICGGGVRYSEAGETLRSFAERFQIPFGETQAGKGQIDWSHPLNLGGTGVTGTSAANKAAARADVVIGIGTKFNDFVTQSRYAFQNEDCKLISLNVATYDNYKLNAHGVLTDAKLGIQALSQALEKRAYVSAWPNGEIPALKQEWDQEVDRLYSIEPKEGFSQTRALGIINEFISENDIIVGASGSLPGCLQRLWRPKGNTSYDVEYAFSCMGHEVNGTLGAKIARPGQEAYAMCGDGSYVMLHSELFTSIQEGLKINILLFDNNGFQCIDNLQVSQGTPSFGNEFRARDEVALSGDYVPIDFAMNAKSYGAQSWTVTNPAELKQALVQAKACKTSTLIHIKVLPKSMTEGYESWWRVGVAEVSESPAVQAAYQDMEAHIQKARKF